MKKYTLTVNMKCFEIVKELDGDLECELLTVNMKCFEIKNMEVLKMKQEY